MDAVAELAVEAVGVEQRQEELEVLLLAVVRRRGHQQQCRVCCAELLGEAEAAGLLELRAEVVRGELVGLVEDDQVPAGSAELVLQLLVAGQLVEADDQLVDDPRTGCRSARPAPAAGE